MAITIFKDKNCKGASQFVGSDIRDLKDEPADKPGSMQLSEHIDSVLLFKNDDWHEGALFIRGQKTVTDLGSAKEGGRFGFGNSIRSVRITPFTLRLNISVVMNGTDYPGIWPSDWWAEGMINDIVRRANIFYLAQHALLNLEVANITFRNDAEHFNVTTGELMKFPGDWKRDGEVDVIFVNRFEKEGEAGCAHKPMFGETVIVSVMVNPDGAPDAPRMNENMAYILVHELGHYLGLGHGTANDNTSNIMHPDAPPQTALLADVDLWDDQIREMHDRLANHHTRRGDRVG
jgi:hypothetical protein